MRSRPSDRGGHRSRGPGPRAPRSHEAATTGGETAVVNRRGAQRLRRGHPWVFRSDIERFPALPAGVVRVEESNGAPLGWALWSPASEISLRQIERDGARAIDAAWWHERLTVALRRRDALASHANAYRLVHGEGDGLPSLVVDRYDEWLVVQLLSAGLETQREHIVASLRELTGCRGILARNDVPSREREGLVRSVELLYGEVPRTVEVREHGVRYLAAPWDGQKTGAFLDQRENRVLVGQLARGRALDCFAYHGSFALHLAQRAEPWTYRRQRWRVWPSTRRATSCTTSTRWKAMRLTCCEPGTGKGGSSTPSWWIRRRLQNHALRSTARCVGTRTSICRP